jgi:hypothetical protein
MTRRSPGRSSKKRGGPWSISPTAGAADTSSMDVSLICAAANAKQLKQQSEQITRQKINERLDGVDHRAGRQKRPRRWLRYAVAMNHRRCRDRRGAGHVKRNPREVVRSYTAANHVVRRRIGTQVMPIALCSRCIACVLSGMSLDPLSYFALKFPAPCATTAAYQW